MAARARTDGFVEPCIPTRALKPPVGPDWVHEIKHDGYRLIARQDGKVVPLFARRGHDWTDRYPAIAGSMSCLMSSRGRPITTVERLDSLADSILQALNT
jgi:ATP-dependent DNA ligase